VHLVDRCAFKSVRVTEYFDHKAELREILSPLNDVQYHWTRFRPAPLAQDVKVMASASCGE
jgi:hypothetical protein